MSIFTLSLEFYYCLRISQFLSSKIELIILKWIISHQSSGNCCCNCESDSWESRADVEDDDWGEDDSDHHRQPEGDQAEQVEGLQADQVRQTVLDETGKEASWKLKRTVFWVYDNIISYSKIFFKTPIFNW